ncbi:MAG: flippase-like domain-containing protein, partial [Gemmatimonadetes bacterium]|nr:flippase-like domain-containing protein [Gemmatimonadota bacterium]
MDSSWGPRRRRRSRSACGSSAISGESAPATGPAALIRRALRIALGVGLLGALLLFVDPGETLRMLRRADPGFLVVALLLAALAFLLSVERWRVLLAGQNVHLPFPTLSGVLLVSTFFNTFLPGGGLGADVIRVHEVRRRTANLVGAAASVLADRFAGLLALLALGVGASLAGLGAG